MPPRTPDSSTPDTKPSAAIPAPSLRAKRSYPRAASISVHRDCFVAPLLRNDSRVRQNAVAASLLRPIEFGIGPGEQLRSADCRDIPVRHAGGLDTVALCEVRRHIRLGRCEMLRDQRRHRARKRAGLPLDIDDAQRARLARLARKAPAEPGFDHLDPLQRVATSRIAPV